MYRRGFGLALVGILVSQFLAPPAVAVDTTRPRIVAAWMADTDGDDRADRVVVTYNEKINHALDTDGTYPFSVSDYRIKKVLGARRTLRLTIVVREKRNPDIAAEPSVTYTRTSSKPVRDLADNQARNQTFSATLPLDRDGDGFTPPSDCAPDDSDIYPSAPDAPEAAPPFVDSNCDGIDGDAASGVFVDQAVGSDTVSCGTREEPCASVATGMGRATATGKSSVFVAWGTYVEALSVFQGRSIYGGYEGCAVPAADCPWGRGGGLTTIRKSGANFGNNVVGMTANNITTPTKLQLVRIQAMSATGVGGSVYGMRVVNSPGLTLEAVTIEAGNGNTGSSGSPGSNGPAGVNGADGGSGSCPAAGPGNVVGGSGGQRTVGGDNISGGNGGFGGWATGTSGVAGGPGQAGQPGNAPLGGSGGAFGTAGSTDPAARDGGDGGDGGPGLDGASGAGATDPFGQIVGGFWQGFGGTSGQTGGNGGGGGGGGGGGAPTSESAPSRQANSGAGGGSGGGGATGGGASSAGGGSFGLFVVNSTAGPGPVVTDSEIISGSGGTGGTGGIGGEGSDEGGLGGQGFAACPEWVGAGGDGGDGGPGGDGGHGGGGAGGASYSVFASQVTGFDPAAEDANNTFIHGQGGAGGASLGNSGVAGASGDTRII
jgi:hypothetical protein